MYKKKNLDNGDDDTDGNDDDDVLVSKCKCI